jgi:hypothetical protein
MPVDLLGIQICPNYLIASTKSISRSHLSINQGSYRGRIYRYITFYRSSAKGYTDREGLHTKSGKVESLISCMIIAANKSSKEVIDDEQESVLRRTLSNTVQLTGIRILHRITLNF